MKKLFLICALGLSGCALGSAGSGVARRPVVYAHTPAEMQAIMGMGQMFGNVYTPTVQQNPIQGYQYSLGYHQQLRAQEQMLNRVLETQRQQLQYQQWMNPGAW